MINKEKNIAYIDGANLHSGVLSFGWDLDYSKFRRWLEEKYGVQKNILSKNEKAPGEDGTSQGSFS